MLGCWCRRCTVRPRDIIATHHIGGALGCWRRRSVRVARLQITAPLLPLLACCCARRRGFEEDRGQAARGKRAGEGTRDRGTAPGRRPRLRGEGGDMRDA
uniref:Uncharacterized protein n=1 Tax=Arundo donax TaxID=35708 RepID=A0A0A9EFS0_ARUDO